MVEVLKEDFTPEEVSDVPTSAPEEDISAPASGPLVIGGAVAVCDMSIDSRDDIVPKATGKIAETTDVLAPEVSFGEAKVPLLTIVSGEEAISVDPIEVPITEAANKTLIDDSVESGTTVVELSDVTSADAGFVKVSEGEERAIMDDGDAVAPVASARVDLTGSSGSVEDIKEVVQDDKPVLARLSEILASAPEGAVGASEKEMPVPSEAIVDDIPVDEEHDDVHAAKEVAAAIKKVVAPVLKADTCSAGESKVLVIHVDFRFQKCRW